METPSSKFLFEGLGTYWEITILAKRSKKLVEKIQTSVEKIVSDFDKKYSRFDSSSFIGVLNSSGTIENYPHELTQMLDCL